MSEESHGLFHLGKKDDEPAAPPPEEHHGLFHLGEKQEEPPPPPPEEHHGLFHFGKEEPPPPPPPPAGLMARLFHRAPVTPEPASPKRPQLFRHHSFRSALYILGLLALLAWIVPGILPNDLRFYGLLVGAALLLGGILLTGDWHPLSGMLGLRKVRVPTSATGVAEVVAEHEAQSVIGKVTSEDEQPKTSVAQRLAPWHWPWSEQSREMAREQKAEEARKFRHVGILGRVLMGIMAAVMGYGANRIIQALHPPASLSSLPGTLHWVIVLVTLGLILFIVFTRIRSFRHHWLSPFGIIRRLIVFLVVTAVVALAATLLTGSAALGQGYGELIGGLAGLLAVLF
ncbi:MAG TPA: hypothetical protein VH590_01705 [Ktedonobacterales bacterium]